MSYPPPLENKDLKVLEIIAKGHPVRQMTATHRGLSNQVSALTWNELQVALNSKTNEFADSIARLGANNYIKSGEQYPSFWGWITGNSLTTYIWITRDGREFLSEIRPPNPVVGVRHDNKEISFSLDDLQKVETYLFELGFDITNFGSAVSLLSLESGYSHCETASCLAVATLALDISEAGKGLSKWMAFVPHGRAMIHKLKNFKDTGLMSQENFETDVKAIVGVTVVSRTQLRWISQVLNDPIMANRRVAISRIKHPA